MVHPQIARGNGNMGTATDRTSRCRFGLSMGRWGVAYIYGSFASGSGDADLTIKLAHRNRVDVFTLHTLKDVGTGGSQVNMRVLPGEAKAWTFDPDAEIVLEWTNPNTQEWTVEIGIEDAP